MDQNVPKGNRKLIDLGAIPFSTHLISEMELPLGELISDLQNDKARESTGVTSLGLFEQVTEVPKVNGDEQEKENAVIFPDPATFWNTMVWPTIELLAEQNKDLTKEMLVSALDVKSSQADAWLQRAVQEGRLKKLTQPVRYTFVDEHQLALISE
jgi:hypothetical protein